MKVGTILLILRDVTTQLVSMRLLTAEGDFVTPTLHQDLELVNFVRGLLNKYNIDFTDEIQAVIRKYIPSIQLVR